MYYSYDLLWYSSIWCHVQPMWHQINNIRSVLWYFFRHSKISSKRSDYNTKIRHRKKLTIFFQKCLFVLKRMRKADLCYVVCLDETNGEEITSLTECLNKFTQPENLGFEQRVKCENCKLYQESVKQLSVQYLPTVLCLHLKVHKSINSSVFSFSMYVIFSELRHDCSFFWLQRFKQKNGTSQKNNTFVEFPLTLDMTPYLSNTLFEYVTKQCDFYEHKRSRFSLMNGCFVSFQGINIAMGIWSSLNSHENSTICSLLSTTSEHWLLVIIHVSSDTWTCGMSVMISTFVKLPLKKF
jgi:hypothetical protein